MTDKMRKTAPLQITFAEGEKPSASKLNAINAQMRSSTGLLEKVIGDPWNQSGDTTLTAYPAQITNICRVIGQQKFINPAIYWLEDTFTYTDMIGAIYTGKNEGYLQFRYSASLAVVTGSPNIVLAQLKATEDLVATAGDWWVDATTGRFKTYSALAATDGLSYEVDPTTLVLDSAFLPGIIPDPRQADFTSCRVSTAGGKHYLHLPPRCPLSVDLIDSNIPLPERYPPTSAWAANYAATTAETLLWQNPTLEAFASSYYRYSLPKEIRNASLVAGDAFPAGFMYIWDSSTNSILYDVVFRKTADAYILEISSDTIDFTSKETSTELEVSYNATGYVLITTGTSLAASLYSLASSFFTHQHNNKGDFSPVLSHNDLLDTDPPPAAVDAKYPADVPVWAPSRWTSDHHVSLLSRAGSQGTAGTTHRDVNDNAMLGDLVLASTTESGGNFLNLAADSNKLCFGSQDSSFSIRYDKSDDCMFFNTPTGFNKGFHFKKDGVSDYVDILKGGYPGLLYATCADTSSHEAAVYAVANDGATGVYGYGYNSTSIGVLGRSAGTGTAVYGWASGAGAKGVHGLSSAGYGVVAQGDTTSPAYAAFRIVPQNANPTVPQEGDLIYHSGNHRFQFYDGSTWRWLNFT